MNPLNEIRAAITLYVVEHDLYPSHIILGTDTYKRVFNVLQKMSDYSLAPDVPPKDESFRLFGFPVLVVSLSEYIAVGHLICTPSQPSSSLVTDSQGQ